MMFTGKPVDAQRALGMGLINRVVPPGQVVEAALELAGEICQCAPLAVQAIKKSMRRTQGMSWEEAIWCESALGLPRFDTQGYQEGRRAFAEKRPPVFQAK